MTSEQNKEAFEKFNRRNHGVIPDFPDGPLLESFNALELAQAMEAEMNRAGSKGLNKIRLDMAFVDAMAMANFLRRAVAAGVC